MASLLNRELIEDDIDAFSSGKRLRSRRPLRITYVPWPVIFAGYVGITSSESEYKDAASSSVLQTGGSGGSGHSTEPDLCRKL